MSHKHSQGSFESARPENGFEETIWQEYYPKLQRYCHFLTQNSWDGDDIAQETYIKALKYSNQQEKMTTALLNKIAYHHWVDLLRKRKNETLEADFDFANLVLTNELDEKKNLVDFLVKKFTPKQAIIFMLKEAFQYQLKEIASMLNTTETAVKANLHRAKKRLEKAADPSFSVDSFWEEEERERLSDIFYEALKNQDPAILIHSIPSIPSINGAPKTQTYSPSSTLCMAA